MSPITDIVPAWKQLVKGETGRNKFITSDDLFYPNVQGKRITHEHGIGEHIRLIHRYFPDATVYPLVINPKRLVGIGQKELTMMINALRKQSHIAVIASVDFSHYISAEYARLHDQKTEYTMYHSTGLSEFMQCEVDCPTCLWLTVNVARGFDQYPHLEHRDFFSKSKIESTSRQLFSFGPLQQTKNGLTLIV